MTDAHAAHAAHEPIRQEEDRISTRIIVLVGAGSLAIFLVAGWAAVGFLRARERAHGPMVMPAEMGRSKIGMVEQDFFDVSVRGARQRALKMERLGSYGWVDERAGTVHIPIERAMELVAQGVRPAPGPQGAVTPGAQP